MMKITRRTLLGTIGATAAASALSAIPAMAADRTIRHYWWGNPERDKRTFAVIDLFQKHHAGIKVSGETIGWKDYWTKMATQTAGGNMADLIQMDYRYLFEYVRRGALKPLDEYIGKSLMIGDFDPAPLSGGKVDGKLYGLNIGSNSQVLVYNTKAFADAGIKADVINWTREEFPAICEKITSATGGKMKGSDDLSTSVDIMQVWVRQNGREFYDADGKVTATAEDIASFWEYWAEMRKAGVVAGKDKTVVINPPLGETGIVTGGTAISQFWSNQMVGIQALMKDKVGAAMFPHKKGGAYGQFIKPSMFMSLTRDAKDVDAAIAYMNDWVNDPESTKVLGLERGIPCSPKVRAALKPSLSDTEKDAVAFFDAIQDRVGKLPLPEPKGAGEVYELFTRSASEVVLGNIKPSEAAGRFIQDAQDIVDRAR